MHLRAGYKQTDVGVIPEDWDVLALGKIFDVQLGKMLDEEKNTGTLKPCLGNRAVQWGKIDTYELPQVKMTQRDINRFRLKIGDILVCEGDDVGRCAVWKSEIEECYYQKALHRLRPIANFDGSLILLLFESYSTRGFFSNFVTQTSIAHLPKGKLVEVPIPVPPPAEQRAIAAALRDADALIDSLDALIDKKRDLKQAAMQQLLTGKTRLPGFIGKWEVKGFDSVLERIIVKRYQVQTSDYAKTGALPIVDQGQSDVVGYTDRQEKRFSCPDGGIIVFGDHTCIVKFVVFDFVVGADGAQVLVARAGNVSLFHFYALQYQGVPSTGYNRHFKQLKERKFLSPSVDEQSAIAEVLSDMDAEVTALETKRDKARALKQGMMQELLTGKIRLL